MLKIAPEILNSFTATFLAMCSAGIVWLIKVSYNKHIKEINLKS